MYIVDYKIDSTIVQLCIWWVEVYNQDNLWSVLQNSIVLFLPLFIQTSLNNQVQWTPSLFHSCYTYSAFLAKDKPRVILQRLEVQRSKGPNKLFSRLRGKRRKNLRQNNKFSTCKFVQICKARFYDLYGLFYSMLLIPHKNAPP